MSLALKRIRKSAVRKGMVLVHKSETPPRGGSSPLRHEREPVFISALQPCGSSRGRSSSYSERPAAPSVAAQMLISPPQPQHDAAEELPGARYPSAADRSYVDLRSAGDASLRGACFPTFRLFRRI